MDASASRSSLQRWLLAALCLFLAALSVPYYAKVRDDGRAGEGRASRSAFLRWRPQVHDLWQGVNVYDRHNYPNPPVMAFVLTPFMLLPPVEGALAWFFFKAALTAVAIVWVLRLIETPGRPFPLWAKALAVVLSLRPIMGDLSHGNVNLFILFLLAASLTCYGSRRDLSAGLLLGLAVACKVTPALFIPYFLWKRSWRVLAGCAAGLVLSLAVVPAAVLGPGRNAELLGSWYGQMVRPFAVEGDVTTEHQNQSLPGVLYRLATDNASFSVWTEDGYVPTEKHNVVELPHDAARWLVKGFMAAFALAVMWSCRAPRDERRGWRAAGEYALIALGMLLFSERTWKHHYVTLLLPVGVLVYYLAVCRPGRGVRAYLIGSLALALLLMTLTGTGVPGGIDRGGKLAQVYGAYLWANLLLVAGIVVVLRRGERAETDVDVRYARMVGPERVKRAEPVLTE